MPKRPLVCDTTLLLYLQRINQIELLPALYGPIYIPEQVALELDMGRLLRSDTFDPRQCPWATVIPVSQSAINALPPNPDSANPPLTACLNCVRPVRFANPVRSAHTVDCRTHSC